MILTSLLPLVTKRHVERRIVQGVSAQRLFEVVLDVDAYQSFLPYCRQSTILSKDRGRHHPHLTNAKNEFLATLTVGIPPVLVETYTSHVKFDHRPPPPTTTSNSNDAPQHHPTAAAPTVFTVTTRSVESHYLESLWSRWRLQDVSSTGDGAAAAAARTTSSSTPTASTATTTSASSSSSSSNPQQQEPCCRVEFEVEMKVRDPIIAAALDQLLPKVAVQQVDAFVKRASQRSSRT